MLEAKFGKPNGIRVFVITPDSNPRMEKMLIEDILEEVTYKNHCLEIDLCSPQLFHPWATECKMLLLNKDIAGFPIDKVYALNRYATELLRAVQPVRINDFETQHSVFGNAFITGRRSKVGERCIGKKDIIDLPAELNRCLNAIVRERLKAQLTLIKGM